MVQPGEQQTADALAETQPVAEEGGNERPTKKRKQKEDVRCGAVSYILTEDEHKTLLKLEQNFPHWSSRCSTQPEVLNHGKKWQAIESEMQALFPDLRVTKQKMTSICSRGRKQREFYLLKRFKEDHKAGVDAKDAKDVKATADSAIAQQVGALRSQIERLEGEKSELASELERIKESAKESLADAEKAVATLQYISKEKGKSYDDKMCAEKRKTAAERKKNRVLVKELRQALATQAELLGTMAEDTEEVDDAEAD